MSSPAKIRVRPRPKAKSTALKPRSLTALKLHKAPEIDATEWVDEDVMVLKSKKAKKLRKSFTREFKLRAISLVSSNRMNLFIFQMVVLAMYSRWIHTVLSLISRSRTR